MFFLEFALFTYVLNIPLFLLKLRIISSKLKYLSQDDLANLELFFEEILKSYKSNSPRKRIAALLLELLPAYSVYMNLVFIWCLLRVKSLDTYKAAIVKKEEFSFIKMIKREAVQTPNK